MVLKISCTDSNTNVSAMDFGEIFKGPVAERPQRGETLVALDGTRYRIEDVVISNNHSDSEYIRYRIQLEYVLKKLDAPEDTTWNDNDINDETTSAKHCKKTKIIFTFPGVGKTYFKEHVQNDIVKIVDVSVENFKANRLIIRFIEQQYGRVDYIFLPATDKELRDAIRNEAFFDDKDMFIVFPDKSEKLNYVDRYRDRGDNQEFVTYTVYHFDEWIDEIASEYNDFILYRLKKDETLTKAIKTIDEWSKMKEDD